METLGASKEVTVAELTEWFGSWLPDQQALCDALVCADH
jgi:hypothetical protein